MQTSVKVYNPDINLIVVEGHLGNFGDDYNEAMEYAFQIYDEIIIANDDIVLNPDSYNLLIEDVEFLKNRYPRNLGFVAARSDYVRPHQSITKQENGNILQCQVISPLFAYISKEAFAKAKFPPINWFSDDVICKDLTAAGYEHFVSRSYVHHAGSQTIGRDFQKLVDAPREWIKENRPQYFKEWYEQS
jgi:GT2 family glycosyltransferase